jgi:hypothetical protein
MNVSSHFEKAFLMLWPLQLEKTLVFADCPETTSEDTGNLYSSDRTSDNILFSILTKACVSDLVSSALSSGNTISTRLSSNFMSHRALKFQLLLRLEASVRLRNAQHHVARRRTSLQSTTLGGLLVTLIGVTPNILNLNQAIFPRITTASKGPRCSKHGPPSTPPTLTDNTITPQHSQTYYNHEHEHVVVSIFFQPLPAQSEVISY